MERAPSPPGTILAAGGLIGTGLATLALVAPTLPARLLESPFADRLASFDLALDALGVVFALAMLACAVGLVAKGASFVTWALALVVVHGIFQLGGAAVEKVLFGGTSTLLTLRLAFAVATSLLCFAPLLAAYVILERRRADPAASDATARRGAAFVIVEGAVACLFLGASVLAMAAYSRSLAAFYESQAPRAQAEAGDEAGAPGSSSAVGAPVNAPAGEEGAGAPDPGTEPTRAAQAEDGAPGAAGDSGAGGADGAEGAAGAHGRSGGPFLTRLASVDGKTRPLWEKGPPVTLVDFWASWCGPCLYELPNLQVLHDRLGDRGVRVVLVNVDLDGPDEVGRFLAKRRIGLGSLVDRDGSVFQELGLRALPSMFLLDAQGRPVRSYVGAEDPRRIEQDILGVLSSGSGSRSRNG
jgi:thiol-disulfide isomerase/thioredoxin